MSYADKEKHSGFILDIKQPTREGYAACLVVTPKFKDGRADVSAKLERNMTKEKVINFAKDLLVTVGATEELVAQISSL